MKLIITMTIAFIALVTLSTNNAFARDQIRIVGSSTVFPFSTVVAEQFGRTTEFKTPVVESTGTGGGFKLFCGGVGSQYPDISNASRAIKESEINMCSSSGITGILEVKIGYDGIVLANSKNSELLSVTPTQLFLALAKDIPLGGNMVENPNVKWSDIDASLPNTKIEVLGPPPTSGTRDAFLELVMEQGAKSFPMLSDLRSNDKKAFKAVAHSIREDGVFIEAGENDNLIIQKLLANPQAFGIFGFSFLDQNTDTIQGSLVNNIKPTFENISNGSYPVSRSLYFYVKAQHLDVIPGLNEFVDEFAVGAMEDGYLSDKGLISLPGGEVKITDILSE